MTLSKKQLVIKSSQIPKAGKGLFTKIDISKGTRILEYKGRITTWKNILESGVFNAYVFYVNRHHVIDAKDKLNSPGRYVNDAKGLNRIDGLTNNSKYVTADCRVYIHAIKDIPAGSEILVSYKKEYWDIIKERKELRLNKKIR